MSAKPKQRPTEWAVAFAGLVTAALISLGQDEVTAKAAAPAIVGAVAPLATWIVERLGSRSRGGDS